MISYCCFALPFCNSRWLWLWIRIHFHIPYSLWICCWILREIYLDSSPSLDKLYMNVSPTHPFFLFILPGIFCHVRTFSSDIVQFIYIYFFISLPMNSNHWNYLWGQYPKKLILFFFLNIFFVYGLISKSLIYFQLTCVYCKIWIHLYFFYLNVKFSQSPVVEKKTGFYTCPTYYTEILCYRLIMHKYECLFFGFEYIDMKYLKRRPAQCL